MTHALKTWPEYYQAIVDGKKKFELRRFDRPFKEGDRLLLQEYDPSIGQYTGKEVFVSVDYVLKGDIKFGLFADFCIMSVSEIEY